MRLNAKGTVGSFGGRKLIFNNTIITVGGPGPCPPPPDPPHIGFNRLYIALF